MKRGMLTALSVGNSQNNEQFSAYLEIPTEGNRKTQVSTSRVNICP